MNNLKEVRNEKNCRMMELAARIHSSASMLSAIERYDYNPRPSTKVKIAAALGVDVKEIWPNED